MTHELNGIGGTTVVASPSSSTSNATTTTASVKHSLRSATKAAKQGSSSSSTTTELEEHHELLVQEEEKLMQRCVVVRGRGRPRRLPTVTEVEVQEEDDEEITSVEEEPDSEATERTMLTVALVQSVVEASSSSGTTTGPASPATNTTIQSTGSGGGGGPPSPGGSHTYGLRKRRRPSGQDLERLEHFQSTKDGGLARVTVAVKPDDNEGDEPADDNALSAQAKAPPPSPKAKRNFPTSTVSSLLPPPSIPLSISSSVPNPLSQLLESSTLPIPPTADGGGGVGTRVPSVVPCPLLIPPPKDGDGTTAPDHPIDHSGSAPPLSSSKVALSGAVGTDATTSAGTDDAAADKRKVTIHEPDLIVSRKRGFSVDLDFFELGDDASTGPSGTGGGRERTFSFECFAFGINADEPLPPLEPHHAQPSHPGSLFLLDHHGRPRGDSIIFDPVSFQDGGIHEQNALESLTVPDVPSLEKPDAPLSSSLGGTDPATGVVPSSSAVPSARSGASAPPVSVTVHAPAAPSSDSRGCLTVRVGSSSPTALLDASGSTPSSTSATFSLELLNKDGRIGIYLPEARIARIQRFHAKRSRRIWRKRIKYDCRKKLADSRPRIKGRFVKRTDGEE